MIEQTAHNRIDYTQLTRGDTVHVETEEDEFECEFRGVRVMDGAAAVVIYDDDKLTRYYIFPCEDRLWRRGECCCCRNVVNKHVGVIASVDSPVVVPPNQRTLDGVM